ncbi:MAG: hypothetical protein KDK65_06330, partial [Chlamydiia bacterium]|nr:hypothetical protein [Chlamydiia bacterium]
EPKLIANQEFNEVGMTIQTPSAEPLKEKFPHVNWLATPPDIRRFAKLAETQEEGTTKLHYLR